MPAPPVARPVEVPGAVHAEVGVQREVVVDAGQQVLAAADHLTHEAASEIGGCELRHPEVRADEPVAGKRVVQGFAARTASVHAGGSTVSVASPLPGFHCVLASHGKPGGSRPEGERKPFRGNNKRRFGGKRPAARAA